MRAEGTRRGQKNGRKQRQKPDAKGKPLEKHHVKQKGGKEPCAGKRKRMYSGKEGGPKTGQTGRHKLEGSSPGKWAS